MRMIDLIETKRDGGRHTLAEMTWLIAGVVDGSLPDYQLAAWLMAVVCRGMDREETAHLTRAMASSGRVLDLSSLTASSPSPASSPLQASSPLPRRSFLGGPVVDKHSTGGVGDKSSLVVVPLAAATGLTVAKMSGRGLGFTGGTVDKLESIPGFQVDLSTDRFERQAAEIGCVIASQSADLAPADARLYALRDVTGTVSSLPLIAASIMSKKIAAGAGAIVLDVKHGRGALLQSTEEAEALARVMVDIGRSAGLQVIATLGPMDEPLGSAVGNALEVREAVAALHGSGPSDLIEHCLDLTALLHVAAGSARRAEDVRPELVTALRSGAAAERFAAMIAAQDGDARIVETPGLLPSAPVVRPVQSPETGYIVDLDARDIGVASMSLGAGRARKGDAVDPAVGVELALKVGDRASAGDVLALVHGRDEATAANAARQVLAAYRFADRPRRAPAPPRRLEVFR